MFSQFSSSVILSLFQFLLATLRYFMLTENLVGADGTTPVILAAQLCYSASINMEVSTLSARNVLFTDVNFALVF